MTGIGKRLGNLERKLGVAPSGRAHVVILLEAAKDYGEAVDVYVNLLREAGKFTPGAFSVCSPPDMPQGMNRAEAERFFREYGFDPCTWHENAEPITKRDGAKTSPPRSFAFALRNAADEP